MELTITYDMRAPDFGAPRSALYRAALDQVAWADELGFDIVGLGEHHGSDDGYNPSPLPLACAMAARTRQIKLRTCIVTPRPEPFAPPILLGGSSAAAARRAAHIADDWFPPLDPRLWHPYREECIKLGKADPGDYPAQGPIFL